MAPAGAYRNYLVLRYLFDSSDQVARHLHAVAGHSLLFFPDPRPAVKGGERVPLEVALPAQQMMLRGTVHSCVAGLRPGAWIEFDDARLARRLESDAASIRNRKHRRLGTDLMIEVREADGGSRFGRLLDFGLGGARISAAAGPAEGGEVQLRILTSSQPAVSVAHARVARAANGEIGLSFAGVDPASRASIGRLFREVVAAWNTARTVRHLPLCCRRGNVIEPPLPRVRARDHHVSIE